MTIFLVSVLIGGLLILCGIIWFQYRNKKNITDAHGVYIDNQANPLSLANLYTSRARIHIYAKEEIKKFILTILKLLIYIKQKSRAFLDKSISKLAHIAFPEQKAFGTLDENTVLQKVEEHKKQSVKGSIE